VASFYRGSAENTNNYSQSIFWKSFTE
jgi:hypothetical protein